MLHAARMPRLQSVRWELTPRIRSANVHVYIAMAGSGQNMKLSAKPDLEQAQDAWNHYWAREPWRRPLLVANVVRKNAQKPAPYDQYFETVQGNIENIRKRIDWMLDATLYLAESIPYFGYDLGPDGKRRVSFFPGFEEHQLG